MYLATDFNIERRAHQDYSLNLDSYAECQSDVSVSAVQ